MIKLKLIARKFYQGPYHFSPRILFGRYRTDTVCHVVRYGTEFAAKNSTIIELMTKIFTKMEKLRHLATTMDRNTIFSPS
jgi:hypothetical protein